MNSPQRNFTVHRRLIQEFIIEAVELVLEQLNKQISHDIQCLHSNDSLRDRLQKLIEPLQDRFEIEAETIANDFVANNLPNIISACRKDFERYLLQDPALSNPEEVFYSSNGFWGTIAHRIAHDLEKLRVPLIPRAISSISHSKTGIDIHPGATIAPGLFIDHGTGIAIGCTAVIEKNVNLYNGVVLGTRSKPCKKTNASSGNVLKRHPTIKEGCSLYTGAFVGGDVVIGENSIVGAHAFVCSDVPPDSVVSGKPEDSSNIKVSPKKQAQAVPATPAMAPPPVQTYASVIDMIGNTPMVQINHMHDNPNVKIFAKVEGNNPSGSVKDRLALSLVEQGEKSGALTHDKIILESTSGNTGIGLAMVGAAKGYQVVLTMSAAMSEERKKVLRAFGATLIETAPDKGTGGAIKRAREMVAEEPGKYWQANQHASLDNPLVHYEKTAVEILNQVPDITHFVAGIGTYGTLRGAGVRLREAVGAKIIGVEPKLGQAIQGLRNMQEPFAPELFDESLLDEKIVAFSDDAYHYTRQLALREGLFTGMSSGAAMHAAVQLASKLESGNIVVLLPDRGEKYLSTPLFDQVREEKKPESTSSEHEFAFSI